MGSHSLLQGIFPTQGSNSGLLQCRQIPYHLSHQVKADNTTLMLGACVCSIAESCPTLCDPMDCGPPGSSVHGIFQKWVAISSSRGSSWLRDQTLISCLSCVGRQVFFFTTEPPGKPMHVCIYVYLDLYDCVYKTTFPVFSLNGKLLFYLECSGDQYVW